MHGNTSMTKRAILLAAVILAAVACNSWAKIIYVDDDANGPGDGSSWQNAYKYLQDALVDANAADKPVEIRVAQGIYRPDRSVANPEGSRDREATFRLLSGVTLKGGYAGLKASSPNARDIELYTTTLSGDLAGNDVLSEDPNDSAWRNADGRWQFQNEWCLAHESTRRENSLHVVTASGVDQTAVLDGFTISQGNAFLPPYWFGRDAPLLFDANDDGAGIVNRGGSPRLVGCSFIENSAFAGGGAMSNSGACSPVLVDCRFERNEGYWGVGAVGCGGGVHLEMTRCVFRQNTSPQGFYSALASGNCTLKLMDCSFVHNSAYAAVRVSHCDATFTHCDFTENLATGMENTYGDLVLTDCAFAGNSSRGALTLVSSKAYVDGCYFVGNKSSGAAAIYTAGKELTLKNCVFSGNAATDMGGALYCAGAGSNTTIVNCTFFANKARTGSVLMTYSNTVSIRNSVFWDNPATEGPSMRLVDGPAPSALTISYSVVQAGPASISGDPKSQVLWGAGNVDVDPCFAEPGHWDDDGTPQDANDDSFVAGDYHLKSQGGRWDPVNRNWVVDKVTSPCIDAGDPSQPVGSEPFPNGWRINMGAYGGTAEASKSSFGGPVCETQIPGDINGDCRVDAEDLAILARNWLRDERPRSTPSSELPSAGPRR